MDGRALTPPRGTLLRARRSPRLAGVAFAVNAAAWLALAVRPAAPGVLVRALALVAAPLALAMAARTAAAFWRGPPLLYFPVEYAVPCGGDEAVGVRAAAQIRGALGGAGYVSRARLALPLAAWLLAAALLASAAAGATQALAWRIGVQLLVVAIAGRTLFPARPFWYREHRGGAVVLYPASVLPRVRLRPR